MVKVFVLSTITIFLLLAGQKPSEAVLLAPGQDALVLNPASIKPGTRGKVVVETASGPVQYLMSQAAEHTFKHEVLQCSSKTRIILDKADKRILNFRCIRSNGKATKK